MKSNKKLLLAIFFVLSYSSKINAQETIEKLQSWTSYSQSFDCSDKVGYEFRVSAAIRIQKVKINSKASIWVRVDKKDGKTGFFQNNVNLINPTNEWKVFEIKGIIDANASRLNIGAYCGNSGDYYFDDFKIEIKSSKGKWETVSISNSGFEENTSKEELWKNGNGRNKIVSVKNFSTEYSSENPYKGNKCLHINAKNIVGSSEIGKFVEVNGVNLYYEVYGEGEPLLMIHGNGNSMSGFIGNVEDLSKHYKVILIDCRGRGESTYNPGVELTFELQIDDLVKFLDKVNIKKTSIIGWSDGGILGLLMAIKHPERVDKLVSMAANIFPSGIVDSNFKGMLEMKEKLIVENVNKINDLWIDLCNLDIKYPNLEYKDLNVIKSKTLIMAGDKDDIKNDHTVKIYEAIPNSQLAIVPNSTHWLPQNNPKLFNQIVLRFLNDTF